MKGLKGMKEGKVLFNDPLDTFYLRLYDVESMEKDLSDSERDNQLPSLHGLLVSINRTGEFLKQN